MRFSSLTARLFLALGKFGIIISLSVSSIEAHPIDASPEEKNAILARIKQYSDAFNHRDSKGLASLWALDGEYIGEDGQILRGRDAITKSNIAYFEANPNATLRTTIDCIRFMAPTVAIEDGVSEIQTSPSAKSTLFRYSTVHVKKNGVWQTASIRILGDKKKSNQYRLKPLQFLIGDWVSNQRNTYVKMHCRWSANKNFIWCKLVSSVDGKIQSSDIEIIGWNHTNDKIVSWTFGCKGEHGYGVWQKTRKGWTVRTAKVKNSGSIATAKVILTSIGKDRFVWESTQRTSADKPSSKTNKLVLSRISNNDKVQFATNF